MKVKASVLALATIAPILLFGGVLLRASEKPQDRTEQSLATTTAPQFTPPTIEKLLELTNAERAKVGVAPLVLDERLNRSAQKKADELALEGWDDDPHGRSDGKRGYSYVTDIAPECFPSENLMEGVTGAETLMLVWMGSKPHADAIKNPRYDRVGFAIGDKYVVQHFCDID